MTSLTLTFLVPPLNYSNDDTSAYKSKTANAYTWSACAANQNSSKCDYRGYSFGGTWCQLSPLIGGRREFCMFPNYLSNYDPKWRGFTGVSEYKRYESSEAEFGECVRRNTRGGNAANRQLLFLYTNISYNAEHVANEAVKDPNLLVELYEIYVRPKEACTETMPILENTAENIRAYNIIFTKACMGGPPPSKFQTSCDYNAIGEKPTECSLIDMEGSSTCRWWWSLPTTPTLSICDNTNLLSPTCFAECSKPDKNCDRIISNFCSSISPEEGITRYSRICGCFQPSSVTLPYYKQANKISPGFVDVTRKNDECFFPACAPLTSLKPFATKSAGNIKCPDQVLCIQPVNISVSDQNTNDIIVKNSCPNITLSLVKCENEWAPTMSFDGNLVKCCPPGATLSNQGVCSNVDNLTKVLVVTIISYIIILFVALLLEKKE